MDVTFFEHQPYYPKTNIQGENHSYNSQEYQFWETLPMQLPIPMQQQSMQQQTLQSVATIHPEPNHQQPQSTHDHPPASFLSPQPPTTKDFQVYPWSKSQQEKEHQSYNRPDQDTSPNSSLSDSNSDNHLGPI